MTYERCIFYTVLLAVVALDRPTLKARVIDSPEVLSVLDSLPHLRPFLSALHGCQYAEFFQVRSGVCGRVCVVVVVVGWGEVVVVVVMVCWVGVLCDDR